MMEVHPKDRTKNKFHDNKPNEMEYLEKNVFGNDGFSISSWNNRRKFHFKRTKASKAEKENWDVT